MLRSVDHVTTRGRRIAVATAATLACLIALLIASDPGHEAGARGVTPTTTNAVAQMPNGLSAVSTATAPGVSARLYVVAKEGTVFSLRPSADDPTPKPFLRLPRSNLSTGGERGLLSIAFAPDFESSRLLYAYFTNARGAIEIDEFRAPSAVSANPASARKVIAIPHPGADNHNGGTAAFGPDGLLYIGTGDGGSGGDPDENAQNKRVLLGKMLRIDPARSGGKPYTIPGSNPFVGERPGRGEIIALGLRNPYRFSFDTETIWIGDVGQSAIEEVDKADPEDLNGANFGWDRWEGTQRYRDPGDPSSPRPTAENHFRPYFEYPHPRGCSITGGVVVPPGAGVPGVEGRYVFADFCEGVLRSIDAGAQNGMPSQVIERNEEAAIDNPTSFGVGPDGRVYVTTLDGGLRVLTSVD